MMRLARLFPPSPRLAAASGRLHAAESGFERSMNDLRRAALDHVERQHRLGATLEATLQRLVLQGANRV